MTKVLVNDSSLMDIADAIREKNGTEETYKPSEMGDAVRSIQSGGGSFNVLQYAKNIRQFLYTATLPDVDEITIDVPCASDFTQAFADVNGVKKIILKAGGNVESMNMSQLFRSNNQQLALKTVDVTDVDFSKITTWSWMFASQTLATIIGEIDMTKFTSLDNVLLYTYSLENLTFKRECILVNFNSLRFSQKLSNESIQSIIDGLAPVETAQTLTLHADVKAKLTETQIAAITSKNWTLA